MNAIEKIDDTHLKISVIQPPIRGKANQAVIHLLARYLKVQTYQIKITSGYASRNKIVEIEG